MDAQHHSHREIDPDNRINVPSPEKPENVKDDLVVADYKPEGSTCSDKPHA